MKLIDPDELERVLRPILKDESCPLHIAADIDMNLDLMPKVDAVPVVRGKWMEIPEAEMFMCSECGEPGLSFDDVYVYDLKPANFCPNCGADMREDGEAHENH